MNGFLGSYVHQVDDKGRLSLPATFRRDVEEKPLVALQVDNDSLMLYPEPAWKDLAERLMVLRREQPEKRAFVRDITSKAVEVTPDKQGRILVPARLLQAVGISGSALLVGAIDRIEVWDPARYERIQTEPTPEAERLAQEIFS